jgi:hypothetical protein
MALPPQIRERVAASLRTIRPGWRGFSNAAHSAANSRCRTAAEDRAHVLRRAAGRCSSSARPGDIAQLKDVILGLKAQIVPDRGAKTARAVKRRRLRQ